MADYDRNGVGSDELSYFFQSDIQSSRNPNGHGNTLFVAYSSTPSPKPTGFSWLWVRPWIVTSFPES